MLLGISYIIRFALLVLLNGIGQGMFSAPNTSSMMSAVPAAERGAASGMRATFQNAGMSLSIGVFFSLLIVGLRSQLPGALQAGLTAQGVPAALARQVAGLPPVSTIFAAFLGYNPVQHLVGPSVIAHLPAHSRALLSGRAFFPGLISVPFRDGLHEALDFAVVACLISAWTSWMRGGKYVYSEPEMPAEEVREYEAQTVGAAVGS